MIFTLWIILTGKAVVLFWNPIAKKIHEVVDIHTKGNQFINKNQGVKLTLKVLIRVNEWVKDFFIK